MNVTLFSDLCVYFSKIFWVSFKSAAKFSGLNVAVLLSSIILSIFYIYFFNEKGDLVGGMFSIWKFLFLVPVYFLVFLISAPFILWKNDSLEFSKFKEDMVNKIESLNIHIKKLEDEKNLQSKDVVEKISNFIQLASIIQSDFISVGDVQKIRSNYRFWVSQVSDYFKHNKLDSEAIIFEATRGNAMMGMPHGRNVEGGAIWQTIEGKKQYLMEFLSQLNKKSASIG